MCGCSAEWVPRLKATDLDLPPATVDLVCECRRGTLCLESDARQFLAAFAGLSVLGIA